MISILARSASKGGPCLRCGLVKTLFLRTEGPEARLPRWQAGAGPTTRKELVMLMSRFDDVAKALAGGLSRRDAMKRIGGGLLGALAAAVGLGSAGAGKARGDEPATCQDYCAQFFPP